MSCIAHAAAVVRDARILSALVTRDASGTILSCSSRSPPRDYPRLFLALFLIPFHAPRQTQASVVSEFAEVLSLSIAIARKRKISEERSSTRSGRDEDSPVLQEEISSEKRCQERRKISERVIGARSTGIVNRISRETREKFPVREIFKWHRCRQIVLSLF